MPLRLDSPLDMHLHLRQDEMLRRVAPLSAKAFSGALVMPNTIPPITDEAGLLDYKAQIESACDGYDFTPYMTLFFRSDYSADFLEKVRPHLSAIKLYPAGITTNSEGGVSQLDIASLRPVLEAMSALRIPLCVHGETGGFVMDREREFLPFYAALAEAFPKLTIVMEHITDKESVVLLDRYDNLYATITLHHLMITLDDVAGGELRPHLFCKPIAKRPEDKEALLQAALTAHPKVMFGSDSAPHPREKKEAPGCAAGVFSAPVALPLLVELFKEKSDIQKLQAFVSDNAKRIYKFSPPQKTVIFEEAEETVPATYDGIVPFFAGKTLRYRIKEIS